MASLTLNYDDLFASFLGAITDYKLASLDQSDAYQLMAGYLRKTIARSYIKRLFTTSSLDDETQIFTFELRHPTNSENDEDMLEWVKLILSKGMVVEWCEPMVRSVVNMSQFFGGKENKYYSQAQHLSELRGLLEDAKLELRREIADRGYINNTYLGNVK